MTINEVDKQSKAVAAQAVHWPMIDALVGATQAMRAAAQQFLPKWPAESDEGYKARLASATLFPAYSRTTEIMAAKPFARPMDVESKGPLPPRVKGLVDDVDMFGTDLQPYAAGLMLDAMRFGLLGVLVDAPATPGARTIADERAAGLRPYFAKYSAASILGWRAARDANGSHLTLLRLREDVVEPDGPWGEKEVTQIRVLTPGAWEIWREKQPAEISTSSDRWFKYAAGTSKLQKIPFVFFYGLRKGFGIGAPPLLDLAYMNVEHWQSSSDQQTILHVARVPILFAKGFADGEPLTVGAASAVRSNRADAELSWVEHSGAAIEAGRQSLLDLEDRMRQTGAELLIQKPATATATQITTETEGSRSTLQAIVEDFEESLEACLALLGDWVGEAFEPEVLLHKDFGAANLSEKGGDLLLRAASDDHVSSETVFNCLKRMDIVEPGNRWDDEKARIASQSARDDAAQSNPRAK